MHQPEEKINQAFVRIPNKLSPRGILRLSWMVLCCLAVSVLPAGAVKVQSLVTTAVDTAKVTPLVQHHPNWATSTNLVAMVDDQEDFEQMTLVLTRPASQQAAFEQLLADQQNPASPSYHKWLTAAEIGERFGVSDADLAAITGWLTGQGLHVNSIAPNRTAIQFGGSALNIGRAFRTSLNYYNLHGEKRLATATEPSIPLALTPVVRAVRGLFSTGERPMHIASGPIPGTASASSAQSTAQPLMTGSSTVHYLTPADFATIYDLPSNYTGAGITIGVVSWSRVSTADLDAYRSKTATSFPNPTEVIPTAYHGVDPGAAYTAPPSTSVDLGGQEEATLDIIRTGATAPGANLLLVAATPASGGIGVDTEYMVYTTPTPVQIISISFGACEAQVGASSVAHWDNLFSTAAAEGISVFVSSGDSAAAGCDDAFSSPPGTIVANSPNYICSSRYATCVGGTQFADTTSPSTYWSSSNGTGYQSALSYIPEGGWNESTTSSVIGTGGGVSTVVATPTWQNVTGVPSARAGRYTPDISFSAAGHDGYMACMAAVGDSTANAGCTGSTWHFLSFSGTSASAPGMAGVAALLAQKLSGGQGNLNPRLYATYVAAPSAFHDTTVTSSGVSSCSVNTPSICNSSIYYTTGGAVQPGFLLTTGFDQVTGLGSLDVATFLSVSNAIAAPTVTLTPASTSITSTQSLSVTIVASGSSGNPTGSVTVSNGTYTSSAATLSSGTATIVIPAGSLASGTTSFTATYTPDSGGSISYSSATSTAVSITVTKGTPTVAVTPTPSTIVPSQSLSVGVAVSAGSGGAAANVTGTVTLTSGSYSSAATTLSSGAATIVVPAGTFAIGTATLSASYTPDTAGATFYNAATGSSSVTVAKAAPTVTVSASPASITTLQSTTVTVTVAGGTGASIPTGSVVLSSGSYTSATTALSSGSASIVIPAGSLTFGNPTVTATYTPDSGSTGSYLTSTGSATVSVGTVAPTLTVAASPATFTTLQGTSVTVTTSGGTGNPTVTGSVVLTSGSYTSAATTLTAGAATIAIPAGSLSAGSGTITATYTPDSTASAVYKTSTGTASVTVTKVAPTVAASASPSSITTLQGTTVTVSVNGGTGNPTASGTVTLTSGTYTSSAATLSAGAATIAVPAGALAAGSPTVTATYTPDTTAAATYATATGTTALTVSKVTPTVTVTPASGTIAVYQALSVLVSVSGGSGATTASGSVVLTGGGYTSPAATLSAGGATITIPASSLTAASSVALTATYTPDTAGAATYNATAGSGSVTVTSLSATSNPTTVTQTKGGSSTATITVSPSYGFTGSVTLTASITSSPSGAQYAPTLSFGATSPVTISGTTPATATLTITTTAASTAALEMPARPGTHSGSGLAAAGSALLACLLLFGIPARRRAWRNLVGLLALAVALMAGASACGGGSKGSTSTTIPGTTAGSYTITVYGNSYAIGTINLTVQ